MRVIDDGFDGGDVVRREVVGFAAGCAEVEQEGLLKERGSGVVDPIGVIRFVECFVVLWQQSMSKGNGQRKRSTHRIRMPKLQPHVSPVTQADIKPPPTMTTIPRRLARPPLSATNPPHERIRSQLLFQVSQNSGIGCHVSPVFRDSAFLRIRTLDVDCEDIAWPMNRAEKCDIEARILRREGSSMRMP